MLRLVMNTMRFLSVILCGFSAAVVGAQAPAMGPEFPVNSYTTGYQVGPGVASDAAGNFVVVWFGDGPSGNGIFARRFDSEGLPIGAEFQINTTSGGCCPSIAGNTSGDFVVTWRSYADGSIDGVSARRYDSSGNPQTAELQVNTYTTGGQFDAHVGEDDAGNFVVVWTSEPGQDGSGYGVFGQRFDSAGNKLGVEFQVNTTTTDQQWFPDVAVDPAGDFIVVWSSQPANPGDPGPEVWGQRYDSAGVPQGGEFHINQYTTGAQLVPRVAMDASGDFVVTWFSYGQIGQYYDIIARRFDAAGNPLRDEFGVNTTTSGNQTSSEVEMDSAGAFTIAWDSNASGLGILARRYDASGQPLGGEFRLNTDTALGQNAASVSLDERGGFVIVWQCATFGGPCLDGSGDSVRGRRGGFPDARPMQVDAHASGGASNVNGVLEAGEQVTVDPSWRNASASDLPLTGAASNLSGPAGPTYAINDSSADYGTIASASTNDCFTVAGDCFEVSVSGARPVAHWDATFDETLSSGVTKTWTLHVGESFPDVPTVLLFYAYIENLFHNAITAGCGGGNYCSASSVTRAQMAVFLLKAKHGATFAPPACTGVFLDVTCPSQFADWIEELAAEGITGGCGAGNYCPDNPVTRAQMAAFLLKAEHGSSYLPPTCIGVFGDVTCPSLFADWIEQLAAEGITGGCGGGNYCPNNPNTRGQMAAFLVKTFGLQLYGP
jgi:hypothetical protein